MALAGCSAYKEKIPEKGAKSHRNEFLHNVSLKGQKAFKVTEAGLSSVMSMAVLQDNQYIFAQLLLLDATNLLLLYGA